MGKIKNMGTATMKFKEGIIVTGSAHNPDSTDSSYSLVVSGTIGVQNLIERIGDPDTAIIFENDKIILDATDVIVGTNTTAGSHPFTVSGSMNVLGDPTSISSANPHETTETLDRNDWYYLPGNTQDDTDTSYQPRFPDQNINVVSSSFTGYSSAVTTSDTVIAFQGGSGVRRMLTYKNALIGDATITFYLIAGGGGNQESKHIRNGLDTGAINTSLTNDWGGADSNATTNYPVRLAYSTEGFTSGSTWNNLQLLYGYRNLHPYADGQANDPDANQDNFDFDGFYAYKFNVTGISGQYYLGLVQDMDTNDHHSWAVTNLVIQQDADARNGYINFTTGSTTVEGVDGYGFRIEQRFGNMQFRDSTGDTSWVDLNSLNDPAGSDGQVQYNNGSAFGGATNLFYNDSNDRVGIGTTDPDYRLDVAGNIGINEYIYHNGDGDTYMGFSTSNAVDIVAGNNSVFSFIQPAGEIIINNGNQDRDTKIMASNGNTTFHADAGNDSVGIGTSTSYAKLNVTSSILIEGASQATSPTLMFQNNDVNLASNAVLGELTFSGFSNPTVNEAAIIRVATDGSYNTYTKSKMTFLTAEGNGQPPAEVMRIEENTVMIGNPTNANAAGFDLTVEGPTKVNNSFYANGSVTAQSRLISDEFLSQTNSQQLIKWDSANNELEIGAGNLVNTSILSGQGGVPLYADSGATYGQIRIGTVSGDPQYSAYNIVAGTGLYVEGFDNSNTIATFVNRSVDTESDGISIIIGKGSYQNSHDGTRFDHPGADNSFIKFTQKDKGQLGSGNNPDGLLLCSAITGDGSGGVTYNTSFTGTHFSLIDQNEAIIGMIVATTGEIVLDGGVSTALPAVTLSNSQKDKRVYGVVGRLKSGVPGYISSINVNDNQQDVDINSIGEGKVWVTNIGGSIENGDYITSSNIAGYGMLQDDDILHSYTVAKCTQAVNWNSVTETIEHEGVTYKKYLIACTYHCG